MDDETIVGLFWQRDEKAISETSVKYGKLCGKIAYGILGNPQDSEEIVNTAYMTASLIAGIETTIGAFVSSTSLLFFKNSLNKLTIWLLNTTAKRRLR